jgi:hypothetical protein
MNTYSEKFNRLIHEYPANAHALARLSSFLDEEMRDSTAPREYSVSRLVDIVAPVTIPKLTSMLELLVEEGVFDRLIRVESPAIGGIEDFTSIVDVPSEILDSHTGLMLAVTPDRLKLIYRTH